MAHVTFKVGKSKNITHTQALELWKVMNHEIEPTTEQARYAANVKALYMPYDTAPESYVEAHWQDLCRRVLGDYMVTKDGRYTLPDWSRKPARDFVKKYWPYMVRTLQSYPKIEQRKKKPKEGQG